MKKIITAAICLSIFSLFIMPGCSNDSEEMLTPSCDTTNVTYSGTIVSILSSNCYVCHAGTTPVAPFRLDSHAAVAVQAGNGKLIGALTHSAGFSPMPKNAPKLSDCNIAKIRKWVNAGFPNN
jgi:hypothetical protein